MTQNRSALNHLLRTARLALHRSMLVQLGVLAGFWMAGEGVVRLVNLPVPGGIVGMVVVLALLASGWLRPASVRRGASWLLAEMLLFFVPAVMAVLDHKELIGLDGLKIAAVILLGTVTVMGGTALAVDLCWRWTQRLSREARHVDA
ncbi:CidA/LrgA family protein [Xanthobacter sp. YC-JY1]|uniref:CidA/LrgA family protein n=1 Tax=Xanthobacter sp. YC-JY1 TaxID=2419844 RepID=UPI001F2F2999|nr:CidA/LrgA family protein [Xanthobacter sp. YC-JY1]UJX45284.1 CidA/LrgA family protein [Xanthobacter sp. YC-JY1]